MQNKITTKVCGYMMEITFDYEKPERGERERGTGLKLSPDLPESIDVTNITLVNEDDLLEMIDQECIPTMDDVIKAIKEYRP